jgi:hypothetical protein
MPERSGHHLSGFKPGGSEIYALPIHLLHILFCADGSSQEMVVELASIQVDMPKGLGSQKNVKTPLALLRC